MLSYPFYLITIVVMINLKRTAFLILTSLLVAQIGTAQNTLDYSSSLGFSSRWITKNSIVRQFFPEESLQVAYRLGLHYSMKISNKKHLSIGGNYASIAFGNKYPEGVYVRIDPDFPDSLISVGAKVRGRENYLEMPVALRMYFTKNNRFYIQPALVPGVHLNFITIIKEDGGVRETYPNPSDLVQKFRLAARIGGGVDWPLTEHLKTFTQVDGQVQLLESVKGTGWYWWDVSLQAGLRLAL